MIRFAGAIWLCGVLLGSCGIYGDKTQRIEFVNLTGVPIVLWQQGRPYVGARTEVAADARLRSSFIDSRLSEESKSTVKFRVEADTMAGELIFCRDYTWNEFTRLRWVIEIRRSNDCG